MKGRSFLCSSSGHYKTLCDAWKNGIAFESAASIRALISSGILAEFKMDGRSCYIFDERHPGFEHLAAMLSAEFGHPHGLTQAPDVRPTFRISPSRPLPTLSVNELRVLIPLLSKASLTLAEIRLNYGNNSDKALALAVKRMERRAILHRDGDRFSIAADVNQHERALLASVWKHFEGRHHLYRPLAETVSARPLAFKRASDGAPRIFGTDVRLRNLMALAKYGPMRLLDLRRITGKGHRLYEEEDYAQFGRGGLVRMWGEGGVTGGGIFSPADPHLRGSKWVALGGPHETQTPHARTDRRGPAAARGRNAGR